MGLTFRVGKIEATKIVSNITKCEKLSSAETELEY